MPKAAADHATHDELLIARLYGDDVDDRERARALDLVAGCDECSALYADLGAIAMATTALPLPSRPREFALTEEDAARLRPRRGVRARLLAVGRRRSFGGALMALGFSGLVLTSVLSMLGTAPTATSLDAQRLAAAPAVGAASSSNAYSQGGVAIPEPAATPAPNKAIASAVPAASGSPGGEAAFSSAAPSPPTLGPLSSTALDQTTTTAAPAEVAGGAGESNPGGPPGQPWTAAPSQAGSDWTPLVLAGSAVALALGLAVLLVPIVLRRSRGRARR